MRTSPLLAAALSGAAVATLCLCGCPGDPPAADGATDAAAETATDAVADTATESAAAITTDGATESDAADGAAAMDARDAKTDAASGLADGAFDAALPVCTNELSNIGAGDFHVSLSLMTTQSGVVAIANQRNVCLHGDMWDLHLVSGTLAVETDDGTNYTDLQSSVVVNDGKLHTIVLSRVSGMLSLTVDGAPAGASPSASVLGSLAQLRVGQSVCDGIGPTVAFSGSKGTITDLCVIAP
jgi:hypothetical protein